MIPLQNPVLNADHPSYPNAASTASAVACAEGVEFEGNVHVPLPTWQAFGAAKIQGGAFVCDCKAPRRQRHKKKIGPLES